jgi:hypothetical protein
MSDPANDAVLAMDAYARAEAAAASDQAAREAAAEAEREAERQAEIDNAQSATSDPAPPASE